ncbi:hypothetical protein GOL95_30515 [Sinorhizobium medicae]|nr:hypothetical protein [Sinorhizobium medicae]MDX1244244.1 hypothetical protein [Sinorhizobium medicae]
MVTLGKMTVGTLAGAAPASALPTTTSPGALLTIEGLMVDFNGVQVLRGIDLMLEPGEGLGIVGRVAASP